MIEILSSFIKINNGDVKSTIQLFINPNILDGYNYIDNNNFYLNDHILCIHKSTLKIDAIGTIVNISENKLCICKRGNKSCIYLKKSLYYIFVKQSKNKNNDRIFYENLLKHL
jgi:hypothetical protein